MQISLIDEATKGAATAFDILPIFNVEITHISVFVCFLCGCSALKNKTKQKKPKGLWEMAGHTEQRSGSAGGFLLLKPSFPLQCQHMLIHEE